MSLPVQEEPLGMGEARYIQPVIKGVSGIGDQYNKGETDEDYPFSFKMSVDGTCTGNANVWKAFDGTGEGIWGCYSTDMTFYALLTFEKPLRIVSLLADCPSSVNGFTLKLYGITQTEDPVSEGTLLGEVQFPRGGGGPVVTKPLITANRFYYTQYRIHMVKTTNWTRVSNIRLDAFYRPADIHS